MHAMILAAGQGTRLRPLTERRPKCLMPVGHHPLLGLWLARLAAAGVDRVGGHTHHHAGQVRSFLGAAPPEDGGWWRASSRKFLGTGGGLVARPPPLGRGALLLANADVLAAADPLALARVREETGAVAVLGLVDDPASTPWRWTARAGCWDSRATPACPPTAVGAPMPAWPPSRRNCWTACHPGVSPAWLRGCGPPSPGDGWCGAWS